MTPWPGFAEAWAKNCIESVRNLGLRTVYESQDSAYKLLCKTFASLLLPPDYIQAALNNLGMGQASNSARYHHGLNSRAGHRSLRFYRLVPVLLSECKQAQRHAALIASGSNDGTNRGRRYRHLSLISELFEQYSSQGFFSFFGTRQKSTLSPRIVSFMTTHYLRACAKLYGPPDME
ncbi:hypothetical protein DPMN_128129 [Dreissena polymorpha]|uniref:Uncharacterized protein n=1 Tax=Dreissena polymorpha TaxID=45954 RepID=A0A9D4JZV0_DREPO|nr:hypothetical protein DPMN_128129 [Dreissena polymorpha]